MSRFYQCDFEDEFAHTDPWWKPGKRMYSTAFTSQAYSEFLFTDERETVEHSHNRLRGFFSYAFRTHEETCESSSSYDLQDDYSFVFASDLYRAARHFDHVALVHLASHAGRTGPPAQEVRDRRGYSFGR